MERHTDRILTMGSAGLRWDINRTFFCAQA